MNPYLRDQLLRLAERADQQAADCSRRAEERRSESIEDAIWWEGLADKARNRAIRCREEAES